MVAANVNARITVTGFAIFIVASIAWMADGWFETKSSFVIQKRDPSADQHLGRVALAAKGWKRGRSSACIRQPPYALP
jgi:hypothetical protein